MLTGCVGRKRTGKTKKAFEIVDGLPEERYLVVVNTTDANYPLRGASYCRSLRDIDFNRSRRWVWGSPDEEEVHEFVDYSLDIGPRLRSRLCVLIDELADYQSSRSLTSSLSRLHRKGENRGVDTVWTTQRPAEVHSTVWTQTDRLYIFWVDPKDLEFMQDTCGALRFRNEEGKPDKAKVSEVLRHLDEECPFPECPVRVEIGVSRHGHNFVRWDKGPDYWLGDQRDGSEVELGAGGTHEAPGGGEETGGEVRDKDEGAARNGGDGTSPVPRVPGPGDARPGNEDAAHVDTERVGADK